jgi:hypothetical protein
MVIGSMKEESNKEQERIMVPVHPVQEIVISFFQQSYDMCAIVSQERSLTLALLPPLLHIVIFLKNLLLKMWQQRNAIILISV